MDVHSVIDYLKTAVVSNQFAQGGIAIALVGGIALLAKSWLITFKNYILKKTTMRIEIAGNDAPFLWCQLWLSESKFGKKTQTLMVREEGIGGCILVPGAGRHLFFYKKRLCFLENIVEPMKADGLFLGYRRSITLHIIPGTRKIGEEFIQEAEALYNKKNKSKISICSPSFFGDSWRITNVVNKRPIESVVLNDDSNTSIMNDVMEFRNNKNRYNELAIPWRRGYLLHGKPGNGKTSLAVAIASIFDYPIYILQLSSIAHDDKLRSLCDLIPQDSILLIEDIDCAGLSRSNNEAKDKRGITLSGMLNVLDGVASTEGRIVIMTTNHPEILDPALIRPGRMDLRVEISTPNHDQIVKMFNRFYPKTDLAERFADRIDYDNISMAQLQVFFLKHKTARSAVNNCSDLMPQSGMMNVEQAQSDRGEFGS